jgi:thiopeptide-type bacteriocin biosynthesis protein
VLRALPAAVLRMSALPAERARPTWRDLDLDDPEAGTAYLREIAADPVAREAVAVSSPSLTHTLDAVLAGRPVERKKLRRAALAVTRYLLRATTRATPFGTLAGVAPAAFGDATAVRVGSAHRRIVRPDAGWLADLVRRRERDPEVLRRLRVVRNALAAERGDRLVLRYVHALDGPASREISVRRTAVIAAVWELAERPVAVAELAAALAERFPAAPAAKLEGLVGGLVEQRLLLTELMPAPSAPDPLAHVLALLPGDPELEQARTAMAAYAEAGADEAVARWHVVAEGGRHGPHVDLAVDAEVTLHREVAAELERAVAALVRMTPADSLSPNLHRYSLDFVVRYGDAQLVPLGELLDPMTGMDAPAGYTVPRTTREVQRELRVRRNVGHDRLRGALVQQAVLDGSGEVVLDDALIDRLALDDDVPPPALDMGIELHARSATAIDRGDFRLVMWSTLMTVQGGALSGRFAHLLGGTAGPVPEGAIGAQLEFTPAFARSANLSRVPRLLDHRIPVGLFDDPDDPAVIGLDDLAVGADKQGLYLWSLRHDAQVVPQAIHMLDPRTQAPNVVRFLCAIASTRQRGVQPWDWGAAGDQSAYLPRVRYGRTVLSAATWRVDRALARSGSFDEDLAAWRKLWRVPAQVALAVADSRVGLDLDVPLHRALLRHELGRGEEVFLAERSPEGTGWLDGHAAELVVSLRSEQAAAPVGRQPALRPARLRHAPGGEWVYVKLYAPEDAHRRLVTEALEELRARLPDGVDRWFFLRYADPLPHLRVRVHGPARELVQEWADALCAADLAQTFALDTYEPEVARYGGIELLETAERAFQADSEAAIAQLRLAPDLPSDLLVAANLADVTAAFGDPRWREWFLASADRDDHRDAFRAVREQALAVIGAGDVDPRLQEIWAAREPAMRAYGDAVRARGVRTPLGSVLHMTHNRLVGIAPESEARANAIARGAVEAVVARDRNR